MPGYGFPRKLRLTEAAQFTAVFKTATRKVSGRYFLILARENQLEHARLGLVVGKKNVPKAIRRNRLKRLLRNSFRLNQDLLAGLDIVILARSDIRGIENRTITENLGRQLGELVNQSTSRPQR